MAESPVVAAVGGMHGFPAMRTSFIGRAGPVRELAVLLEQRQLVTVTGPGGSGKTRLAGWQITLIALGAALAAAAAAVLLDRKLVSRRAATATTA